MSPTFTNDDVDKRVENAAGDVIGVVTAVEGDSVRVEPRSGVMRSIRSALGWGSTRDDAIYVRENSVDEISSDAIRIAGEPLEETAAEPSPDRAAETDSEERETGLGPAPDEGVGRREREPGNAAEPGTGAPDERAHPTEGVSEKRPPEPTETRTGGELGEADANRAGEPHGENAEEAGELPDDDTAELDAAAEMERVGDAEEATVDPTDGSETREESGSIPVAEEELEPDEGLLEERQHGVGEDSVDDVDEIAEMDAVDESTIDAGSERDARDADAASGNELESDSVAEESDPATETEVPRDVTGGVDVDSLEEAAESGAREGEPSPGADADPADVLDVGTDPKTLEAVAGSDAAAEEREAARSDAEEMDLAAELDRGSELESAAESGPTAGDGTAEVPDPTTHRIGSDVPVDARTGTDDEAAEPPTQSTNERSAGGESPAQAAIDSQRATIAEGGRALTRGLRVQREVTHLTIEMQAELGRRSIEQFRSVTHAYVDALAAMAGAADRAEDRSTDREDDSRREDGD